VSIPDDTAAATDHTPWRHALRGAIRTKALSRTMPAAFIVGSILFMVNLYSAVRTGPLTWMLAVQITLTFLVPWLNATVGIAIGLRQGPPPGAAIDPAGEVPFRDAAQS